MRLSGLFFERRLVGEQQSQQPRQQILQAHCGRERDVQLPVAADDRHRAVGVRAVPSGGVSTSVGVLG